MTTANSPIFIGDANMPDMGGFQPLGHVEEEPAFDLKALLRGRAKDTYTVSSGAIAFECGSKQTAAKIRQLLDIPDEPSVHTVYFRQNGHTRAVGKYTAVQRDDGTLDLQPTSAPVNADTIIIDLKDEQ